MGHDAGREVGRGRISEEGADSKTRQSEGPRLEPCQQRRRDFVTAEEAQRTTLEKVRVLQRKLYRAAKAQPQRTFGVLFDKVCSLEVLWVAWEQVRRNRGAAGVDGETIESIEAKGTLWFLLELREELIQQRYRPQPVRRVFIPKPDGRQRPLGIPTVIS
jgi:RNA-directed DNA polymerase